MRTRVAPLSVTNPGDSVIKVLCAGDDANFHPQVVDGNIAAVNLWKSDRILFGGENRARTAFEAAVDHIDDRLLRVTMVVRIPFGVNDVGAQAAEPVLETFRDGDAGNGGDLETLQRLQRTAFARENILQVERLVGALDDFGLLIELADRLAEFLCAKLTRFRDEDVISALEIGNRLAQGPAGQEIVIAERVVAVDEADIETALERQVLEAIVEQERVAAELGDGVTATLDAVLVDQDDNV